MRCCEPPPDKRVRFPPFTCATPATEIIQVSQGKGRPPRVSHTRHDQTDEAPGPQREVPYGAVELCRGGWRRERQHHAQAGIDVCDAEAARVERYRNHRYGRGRGAAGWLWLPALARCQLPAGTRRHLRVA